MEREAEGERAPDADLAIYREFNALFLHRDPAGLAELLIEGLVRAGAARRENGYLVASAHLSFPGIGHIRSEGKGYAWVPVNYTPVR